MTTYSNTHDQRELFAVARDQSRAELSSMPWLPQLPEAWAQDLHDRIEDEERRIIAPNLHSDDYTTGTAESPDEILRVTGNGTMLYTAEHATRTIRAATGKLGFADQGTGGLAAVAAQDYGTALIMRGRQTSNPATDPEHPIKARIADELPEARGFLSVHGMSPGKFIHDDDRTEIQAVLGLGAEPTEKQYEFAKKIVKLSKDLLGLYVVIGNDIEFLVQKEGSTEIMRNADGTPIKSTLAGIKPNSTTNFTRRQLTTTGQSEIPALQIEMTRFLRYIPRDEEKRDRVSRIVGVALGYKLVELITNATAQAA